MSPISDKSSHAPGTEPESFSTQKGEHESTLQIIIQTCPTNTSACWRPGPDACPVLHTSLAELSLTSPSAPHSLSHSVPGQRGPPHPHIVDKLFLRIAPQRSLHASDLHTFLCSQLFKRMQKCVPWKRTFLINWVHNVYKIKLLWTVANLKEINLNQKLNKQHTEKKFVWFCCWLNEPYTLPAFVFYIRLFMCLSIQE